MRPGSRRILAAFHPFNPLALNSNKARRGIFGIIRENHQISAQIHNDDTLNKQSGTWLSRGNLWNRGICLLISCARWWLWHDEMQCQLWNVLCCVVLLNELNCEVTANLRTYLCPLSTPEGEEDSNCRSCRNVIPRSNLVTARPAAFNRHNLIHRDIFLPYQNCEKSPLDIWYELSSNPAILPLYLLFYFSDYPWYPGKMETHFLRVSETCQPYPAADDGGV